MEKIFLEEMMNTQNKPREIKVSFNSNGSIRWATHKIDEHPDQETGQLFREVLPDDERGEVSAMDRLAISRAEEIERLEKELSETTERVKELEEFAKMVVEVVGFYSSTESYETWTNISDPRKPKCTDVGIDKGKRARNFQYSDIYKKVVGK